MKGQEAAFERSSVSGMNLRGGAWTPARSGRTLEVKSPYTGRALGTVPDSGALTACSIFIDSMTTTAAPAATTAPGAAVRTTVPWSGEISLPSGSVIVRMRPE